MNFGGLISLICVSMLWGVTNPLMGKGSAGIQAVTKQSNWVLQFVSELKFLLLNWRFILPFLVNQCGSVLFYYTLSNTELSVAVPLTNGLTFLFTAVTGQYLGEHPASTGTWMGILCILLGVALCLVDRI